MEWIGLQKSVISESNFGPISNPPRHSTGWLEHLWVLVAQDWPMAGGGHSHTPLQTHCGLTTGPSALAPGETQIK